MTKAPMTYPELPEVEAADTVTLARWCRFLPSPGMNAVERDDFETVIIEQAVVMNRITERFKEAGGWTPELSKAVGW